MRRVCIGAIGVLMIMGLAAHGQQDKNAGSAAPGDVVQQKGPARGVNPQLKDIFAAFQIPPDPAPEVEARLTLDDLITHFKSSSITNNFIKHEITDDLRAWHITEQAHSTVGRYSFTINRLRDRPAARASLEDVRAHGHQGAMNGVFVICIHRGYDSDPVLAVFRAFHAPQQPAGSDSTNRADAAHGTHQQ
jgi:hypothetical protein